MTAIHSMEQLVAALRDRRDELGLGYECIDHIAGWPSGYAAKLLAPEPFRNLGWMSLGAALDTLAIELLVVENPEQRKRIESRWKKRERPHNGTALSIPLSIEAAPVNAMAAYMKKIGKRGGKARLKTMSKRARQRIASHAARKRWSKVK